MQKKKRKGASGKQIPVPGKPAALLPDMLLVIAEDGRSRLSEGRRPETVSLSVPVADEDGAVREIPVTAERREPCDMFFISRQAFGKLQESGVPVCRICDAGDLPHRNGDGMSSAMTAKRDLYEFGYLESVRDRLPAGQRRAALLSAASCRPGAKRAVIAYLSQHIRNMAGDGRHAGERLAMLEDKVFLEWDRPEGETASREAEE